MSAQAARRRIQMMGKPRGMRPMITHGPRELSLRSSKGGVSLFTSGNNMSRQYITTLCRHGETHHVIHQYDSEAKAREGHRKCVQSYLI